MTGIWLPYLHASCSRAGEVLIRLYLGALVVHGISCAAHCRFACGFILLQAGGGFFSPQKKTKLDCDKYVAPNKNMQHLLSNFVWRSRTVNYIGYTITLFFNYMALTHWRAALLNLVAEQGGSGKGSVWWNCLLQTNVGFVRAMRGRTNLIFHLMTTLERQNHGMLKQTQEKHFFFHTWRKGFTFNICTRDLSSFTMFPIIMGG